MIKPSFNLKLKWKLQPHMINEVKATLKTVKHDIG